MTEDESDFAFKCAICLFRYDGSPDADQYPMQLTCGHTFCRLCVDHMAALSNFGSNGTSRTERALPCPLCRKTVCVSAAPCYQYLDALAAATKAPAPSAAPHAEPRICDECFVRVLDRAGGEIGIAQLCKHHDVLCDACKNELHAATGFVPVAVAVAVAVEKVVINLCECEPTDDEEEQQQQQQQQQQEDNAGGDAETGEEQQVEVEDEVEVEDGDEDEDEEEHSTGGDDDGDEDWVPDNRPPFDIHVRVRLSPQTKPAKKRCARWCRSSR
jgi:hypothetical protein